MDTEPVNPFQSPQAEDPLPVLDAARTEWRRVLLGLLVSPLARPLSYFVFSFFLDVPYDLSGFLIILGFSYLIALPAIGVAAWLHRRNRLTPLSAFIAWGWIPLVWVVVAQFTVTYRPPDPTPFERVRNVIITGFMMEAPFIAFALYLSYLRRRDQNRGHEPRG